MLDTFTQREIENISMDILKQSKSKDVLPTPVDQIVRFSDLVIDEKINLSDLNRSLLSRLGDALLANLDNATKQIRGLLDRSEKTIYLDLSMLSQRQSFVKLHETGHGVLPWQKATMHCIDDDDTLAPEVREAFEDEANYFASTTLFQHDRFNHEMDKLELSLKGGMLLATKFGSSKHAALRRMVEQSSKRCALLVLNRYSGFLSDGLECTKKNLFHSKKFTAEFGELSIPEKLGYDWVFAQDYIVGKRFHEKGIVSLITLNGEVTFHYHYFNNTYNAFFLIIPQGEIQRTRTTIIINSF